MTFTSECAVRKIVYRDYEVVFCLRNTIVFVVKEITELQSYQ